MSTVEPRARPSRVSARVIRLSFAHELYPRAAGRLGKAYVSARKQVLGGSSRNFVGSAVSYKDGVYWCRFWVSPEHQPRSSPPARKDQHMAHPCLLYTSPSPRDRTRSRMPSSA